MTRLLSRLRRFAMSLAGRIALILAVGISCAAIGALFVADKVRQADYKRWRSEQVVLSAIDVANRLARDRTGTLALLDTRGLIGVKMLPASLVFPAAPDAALTEMARGRAPAGMQLALLDVTPQVCMSNDPFWKRPRVAGFKFPITPECWLMTVKGQGETLRISIDLPRFTPPHSPITQPLFLVLIIAASTLLSILVASLATAPIRRLAAASRAFARSIDADPVAESGPEDVRQALVTFNTMQDRVREGLRERTRLLAAISHDLQTPLTRLRLRLEQVQDDALRERLVTDLSATLAMVRRGLDLARASESAEHWSVIDLDSMLAAMVEDAADVGHAVRFTGGCGARVRVRPDALSRCLGNVIDNAIRYAGGAEVSCRHGEGAVIVSVRDHGAGMPEDLIARAFEPFVRGDKQGSTLGTGIGLTIAQAQARATDGELEIGNHPEGGLLVELRVAR
jgi:signal transduction histidine kinase